MVVEYCGHGLHKPIVWNRWTWDGGYLGTTFGPSYSYWMVPGCQDLD